MRGEHERIFQTGLIHAGFGRVGCDVVGGKVSSLAVATGRLAHAEPEHQHE